MATKRKAVVDMTAQELADLQEQIAQRNAELAKQEAAMRGELLERAVVILDDDTHEFFVARVERNEHGQNATVRVRFDDVLAVARNERDAELAEAKRVRSERARKAAQSRKANENGGGTPE